MEKYLTLWLKSCYNENNQLLHKFYSVICYQINIKMKINFVLECVFFNQLKEVEIFMLPFSVWQMNTPNLRKMKMRTHWSSSLLENLIFKPCGLSRALADSFQHCYYWQWSWLSFSGNSQGYFLSPLISYSYIHCEALPNLQGDLALSSLLLRELRTQVQSPT